MGYSLAKAALGQPFLLSLSCERYNRAEDGGLAGGRISARPRARTNPLRPSSGKAVRRRMRRRLPECPLGKNEFFFLLAARKAVVQSIPIEVMYAVVASSYRGLVVLRCCQMQDSRLSGHVLDARSGPVETRLADCGVGLNTCGEIGGAGCAAFHVRRPPFDQAQGGPSATCDGSFPTAAGGMLSAGNLH
jgi:hypothetical protein